MSACCVMSIKITEMLKVLIYHNMSACCILLLKMRRMLMVLTSHNVCMLYLVNENNVDVTCTYLSFNVHKDSFTYHLMSAFCILSINIV